MKNDKQDNEGESRKLRQLGGEHSREGGSREEVQRGHVGPDGNV